MKVLIDHQLPFLLAHGGLQFQIERTKQALVASGIEVECLRWWDEHQFGDLIHHFGVPSLLYAKMAQSKGLPLVLTHLLSATCNRSTIYLKLQAHAIKFLFNLPGFGSIRDQTTWPVLRRADQVVVGLQTERRVLSEVFGVSSKRISVVPLGVDDDFYSTMPAGKPNTYLIAVGTIVEVKQSVELAHLAKKANVPILFVGKPYSETDPYWLRFREEIDDQLVLYRNHATSRQELKTLMAESSGFVLFSKYENWSLAAHEAAAMKLPLLLPDKPWSRERFGRFATYFSGRSENNHIQTLKQFYDSFSPISETLLVPRWADTAKGLKKVYETVLANK